MRKYLKYKDTGIDGIGDVPEHWKIIKLKYIAKICNGQDQKDVLSENGKYPIYGSGGIFGYANKFLFEGPSVLLGRKGTVDKPRLVIDPFWAVDTAYYTKISNKVTPAIFYHLCKQIRFDYYIYGSAVPSMTSRDLNEIRFALPTLIEQKQIERFLDYKTAQIDSFIANRQKQIELLKEQKAGIINKAVTKGINPNAKMKASGIEWIGDIPEHWRVSKVKFVSKVKGRIGFRGYTVNDLVEEGQGALTLGATHINKDGEIDLSKAVYISWDKYYESPEIMVEKEDILVVQRGSVGVVGIVNYDIGFATINPSLVVLKRIKMNRQLLFLQLRSKIVKEGITTIFNETAVPMLSQNQISNFNILLPPTLDEQQSIIDYIKSEVSIIDTLISKYQKQIDLMQEYRTSLISQAVTGKIDVRDWKPKIKEYSIEKPENLLVAEE